MHGWGGEVGGSLRPAALPGGPALPALLFSCFTPSCPARGLCLPPAAPGALCPWGLPPPKAVSTLGPWGLQLCVGTIPSVAMGAELGAPSGTRGAVGCRGSPGDGRVGAGAVAHGVIRQRGPARCRSGTGERPWTGLFGEAGKDECALPP